jgi:hypothetical protein
MGRAQTASVQPLPFFLCASEWDAEALTTRRIEGRQADPLTMPHAGRGAGHR